MALKTHEVLDVVGKTLIDLGKALEDGKIDRSEVIGVVQKTVMNLLAEYSDDD